MNALLLKLILNFWPCIRGTGARITYLSKDFKELKIKLPLNWRTRNRVGTLFGGSLYASVDPFYMIQLMQILGKDYVVWDKAANIQFKRPGRETLYAHFLITDEQIANLKKIVSEKSEFSFVWKVELKNKAGIVHTEVDKTLYVAERKFYQKKLQAREAAQ